VISDENNAVPAGCLIDARSYPGSPAESSLKHVRVSLSGRANLHPVCPYTFVLIRAGSPFIPDRNYRADVKLPIRIYKRLILVGSLTCRISSC
jgi:hypothetical protein